MAKILVVDDEQDLCEILSFNLESEGYEVDTANSAEEALKMFSPQYDLLLLDVMMDEMSGYQMAKKIRTDLGSSVPIIFLTAKDTENDMLTGFSIGADDYITKPFSLKTVLARIKAVLKRCNSLGTAVPATPSKQLSFDGFDINLNTKVVFVNGVEINLTKKEFLILEMLATSPKHYFSREQILTKVWDNDTYVTERSVDVHIARLRKKLGTAGNHIVNRTGFGYCFDN